MKKQYKKFKLENIEVKKEGRKGIFTAFLSKYGVVDYGNDRVLPSFGKSNHDRIIPLLKQHEVGTEHGSLKMVHSKEGLIIEGELFLEKIENSDLPVFPEAYKTYALLKRGQAGGVPVEFSMGYMATDYEYSDIEGSQVRDLKEGEVFEGSRVTFAMNPEATQISVKKGGEDLKTINGFPSEEPAKSIPSPPIAEIKSSFSEIYNGKKARKELWSILDSLTESIFTTLRDEGKDNQAKKSDLLKSIDEFSGVCKSTVSSIIDSIPEGQKSIELPRIEVKEVKDIFDSKESDNNSIDAIEEIYNIFKGE